MRINRIYFAAFTGLSTAESSTTIPVLLMASSHLLQRAKLQGVNTFNETAVIRCCIAYKLLKIAQLVKPVVTAAVTASYICATNKS